MKYRVLEDMAEPTSDEVKKVREDLGVGLMEAAQMLKKKKLQCGLDQLALHAGLTKSDPVVHDLIQIIRQLVG